MLACILQLLSLHLSHDGTYVCISYSVCTYCMFVYRATAVDERMKVQLKKYEEEVAAAASAGGAGTSDGAAVRCARVCVWQHFFVNWLFCCDCPSISLWCIHSVHVRTYIVSVPLYCVCLLYE